MWDAAEALSYSADSCHSFCTVQSPSQLEHGPVTLDFNWGAARFWTDPPRNLSPTLPSRALQDLS